MHVELIQGPYPFNVHMGDHTRCRWVASNGEHVVTSSVRTVVGRTVIKETLAFDAGIDWVVISYSELSRVGYDDHRGAIEAAGYTIKEN